jgi:hypothetical protein
VYPNQKQRELLTELLQIWQQSNLPTWDKYDWSMYTTMTNTELAEAIQSLEQETE